MTSTVSTVIAERTAQARMTPPSPIGDKAFEWLTLAMALAVVVLVILLGWQLWNGSSLAIRKFGFHFLTSSTWDPVAEDFRFSMTNAPGANAYPIAGATWLLVYEQQKDPAKGKKLVEFLKWAVTKAEGMARELNYAPLPDEIQQRVLKRIDEIKF